MKIQQQQLSYFVPTRHNPLIRPRRTQAAVAILFAATLAVNGVLIALIHSGSLLDRGEFGSHAALISGPVCNLLLLVAAFAMLPIVRRQSGGALVPLYVISAVGFPLMATVVEFFIVAFVDGPRC